VSGAIASINWNPAEKTLRQFGWVCLVGFTLVTWVWTGRPLSFSSASAWTPTLIALGLGAMAAVVGSIYPKALKPIFVGLSMVTFPIGLVISELFLATIFLLLFGSVALLFRMMGFDPMTRQFDRSAHTYWTPKAQPQNVKQYYKQY
jgi:hypothetical protein